MKTLNDSSLNFKYSTLEKATASFDEANKLGQGGFGTVYKVRSELKMLSSLTNYYVFSVCKSIIKLLYCREFYKTGER